MYAYRVTLLLYWCSTDYVMVESAVDSEVYCLRCKNLMIETGTIEDATQKVSKKTVKKTNIVRTPKYSRRG